MPAAPLRTAVTLALAVAALVSGCSAGHGAAAPKHETATATTTPTPTVIATVSPVSLPAECTDIIAADVYKTELASTPLNAAALTAGDPFGAIAPTTAPKGSTFEKKLAAAVQLRCLWEDPTVTDRSMELTLARIDVDAGTSYLSKAKLLHWNCADTHGGRECQKVESDKKNPVDQLHIVFLRDDVFIDVSQTNFIVNDIIGSMVARIWH